MSLAASRRKGAGYDEVLGLTERLNAEELIALLEWASRNPATKRASLVCDAFSIIPAKLKYKSNEEFLLALTSSSRDWLPVNAIVFAPP